MMNRVPQYESRHSVQSARPGFVLLWVIVAIPAIVFLMGAVVDISRVWIARIELTNALEAAALSGVKTWGEAGTNDSGARANARGDAVIAAAANTVIGQHPYADSPNPTSPAEAVVVTLDPNGENGGANGNTLSTGELVLGQLTPSGSGFSFNANTVPGQNEFGVRAYKTMRIYSIWKPMFGIPLGPYTITADAVALYDDTNGQPRIVHVVSYTP